MFAGDEIAIAIEHPPLPPSIPAVSFTVVGQLQIDIGGNREFPAVPSDSFTSVGRYRENSEAFVSDKRTAITLGDSKPLIIEEKISEVE